MFLGTANIYFMFLFYSIFHSCLIKKDTIIIIIMEKTTITIICIILEVFWIQLSSQNQMTSRRKNSPRLRRGPSIWGQCGDLHLDGSFSLGSGGRSGGPRVTQGDPGRDPNWGWKMGWKWMIYGGISGWFWLFNVGWQISFLVVEIGNFLMECGMLQVFSGWLL